MILWKGHIIYIFIRTWCFSKIHGKAIHRNEFYLDADRRWAIFLFVLKAKKIFKKKMWFIYFVKPYYVPWNQYFLCSFFFFVKSTFWRMYMHLSITPKFHWIRVLNSVFQSDTPEIFSASDPEPHRVTKGFASTLSPPLLQYNFMMNN